MRAAAKDEEAAKAAAVAAKAASDSWHFLGLLLVEKGMDQDFACKQYCNAYRLWQALEAVAKTAEAVHAAARVPREERERCVWILLSISCTV